MGALPAVALVVLLAWQGLSLARQQAEAEADARGLARGSVLCGAPPAVPTVSSVDQGAPGATAVLSTAAGMVSVTVTIPAISVLPGVDLSHGPVTPRSTVTMRHEPC